MEKTSESSRAFFNSHPIFTVPEFSEFLNSRGSGNPRTREALVRYYRQQGAILPIRRGVYCSVPPGTVPDQCPVDSYLLAAKLASDAVLAYHTALEAHGRSYSAQDRIVCLTLKYPT